MSAATRPLEPREVAALLQSMGSAIAAEINASPDDVLAWHPAPGEWCAKECLGHMLEAERRGFNGRIRTILSSLDPALPSWDQQAVERERNDCARPPAALLAEFAAIRADSVALVNQLSTSDLDRGGMHEVVGHMTVKDVVHEWVHHDRNHFRQLQANIQSYVWPSMGNCQKFAGE